MGTWDWRIPFFFQSLPRLEINKFSSWMQTLFWYMMYDDNSHLLRWRTCPPCPPLLFLPFLVESRSPPITLYILQIRRIQILFACSCTLVVGTRCIRIYVLSHPPVVTPEKVSNLDGIFFPLSNNPDIYVLLHLFSKSQRVYDIDPHLVTPGVFFFRI